MAQLASSAPPLEWPESLRDLHWFRVRQLWVQIFAAANLCETPQAIVQAVLKQAATQVGLDPSSQFLFHLPRSPLGQALVPGRPFPVEILLFRVDELAASAFLSALAAHLAEPRNHFQLRDSGPLERRSPADLCPPSDPLGDELCLELLTPLDLKPPPDHHPAFFAPHALPALINARLRKLFARPFPTPPAPALELITSDWRFVRFEHRSKSRRHPASGAPTIELIQGQLGRLYLRGPLAELLPWLVLGAELGLGTKSSYARGRFSILPDAPPSFARELGREQTWRGALETLLLEDDAAWSIAAENAGEPAALLEPLRAAIADGSWRPQPRLPFAIPRPDGPPRELERLEWDELLVQRVLLGLLQRPFDRQLREGVFGHRKGRGREDALAAVQAALKSGFQLFYRTDLADCFAQIELPPLERRLAALIPRADETLLELLRRCLYAPILREGRVLARTRGLAQGAPLSPLLANLALAPLDEALAGHERWRWLRYGDDGLILARDPAALAQARALLEAALTALGQRERAEKCRTGCAGEGFEWLGQGFRGWERLDIETPSGARKPFYVSTPYVQLGVRGAALELSQAGRTLELVPLRRISELVVLGTATLSTTLLYRCQEEGVRVQVLLESAYRVGEFGRVEAESLMVSARQAARFGALTQGERLALAVSLVQAKLAHYEHWLEGEVGEGRAELLEALREASERAEEVADLAELRGVEGRAAGQNFAWLRERIQNPALRGEGRDRRGADPFNTLLNYGYALVFARLNGLMRAAGVNPYLGLLHEATPRYEALVWDLVELFRWLVERLVVRLFNQGQVGVEDFRRQGERLLIQGEARKRMLLGFEESLARRWSGYELTAGQAMAMLASGLSGWASGRPFPLWQPAGWREKKEKQRKARARRRRTGS